MDLLKELVKAGLVFDGVHVDDTGDDTWQLTFDLGVIPAGTYEGGLWGDVTIAETDAKLTVIVGDLFEEGTFEIGEGIVGLNYTSDTGLAYTGELEDIVTGRIATLYPGLTADGSEQGMQGDDYLSLDLWVK